MASQALELTSGRGTGSLPLALWASEALRPPNTPQVRSARFFGGEPFVELLQSSGVVHAADGVSLIIANHALILHVVAGRGKWIPPLAQISTRGGWTNRREFRLPETEGGGGDLCSRAITLTTA